MKGRKTVIWIIGRILCVGSLVVGNGLAYAGENDGWVSKIVSVQGLVLAKRLGETDWRPVGLNDTFFVGDQIQVGAHSRAGIVLNNDSVLRLDQNTTLVFIAIEQQTTFVFKLLKGAANFFSHRPRSLKVLTPFVNGVVEGTEFYVRVEARQTHIDLFDGRIIAENPYGTLHLKKGQGVVASIDSAPQRRILVRPRDSVQWALYYPFIIATQLQKGHSGVEDASALFNQGRPFEAIAALEHIGQDAMDSQFYLFRAGLLLHVGRVSEAESDIRNALEKDPENGDGMALQAVIAVVQNRTADAVQFAEAAVKQSPESATAQIALSYALQSNFRFEEALQAAQDAVARSPKNGLAWARLAELQLSVGELDRGERSAGKSVALNPRIAYAHTTLGFAFLTRIKIKKAGEAFEQAIVLDSTAPLPRLGLGLARIRAGALKEGRREIEIAAGLDPDNALIRSYLGKAYFDEKREPLDRQQFDISKALDPNDPTPWFYDAIRKQTVNRPGEAFDDLQKSIALNDNRAVYRSRLLLDEDQAARGASLARIYDDLGFQQKALVESTRSLNIDPTNHSAHRFLSDTYTQLPQYQIAQVSELLQSQLLQPININPVQPQMGIKGLNNLTSVGLGEAAFNEYAPLFEQNRPRLTASGVVGNNDTYGGEAVLSGLSGKFSYSLGQYYYKTDGFRDGSDVKHDVFNAFTQAALTNKVNVQFEYRHRDTDQGDPRMFLDPNFVPIQKRALEQDVGRVGLNLSPSSRSDVIASFIYSDRREGVSENMNARVDVSDDREGYETEAQYLFHENRFNFLFGGGVYRTDADFKLSVTTEPIPAPFPGFPEIAGRTEIQQDQFEVNGENIYTYTTIKFPDLFTWTFGLSYETYEDTFSGSDLERINPKLGLQWDVTEKLRFRTAFVRNIKRLLVVDQTIEPTQVAGFNQFFDDINGTRTQLFGIATDATLTDELYGGIELMWRDLTHEDDRNEEVYSGYLYWMPHPRWSLNTECRYERDLLHFDLKTTTVPVFIKYYDPRGFFGRCGVTYVSQKEESVYEKTLSDDFAVVDAAVGYRLPKRWGLVSLEISNLFDEEFYYRDASFKTSDKFGVVQPFVPSRTVLIRVVLNI